ncbi:ABC transporter ATP-binding protein [Paraburkholderia silvatlantica]|uniref:Peptide/nickel transport system ATP-binding protein n=1 Tax=Paraburkholderia silvatlantica TaxID=321895 RepID=A0ABR6FST6_9BURK|nr:ABC transporter ATP-binding protein [Paraburkholderia silvatlantica]MBB2930501.1 peptide/nickel transport system ATP-binding protein [Paraburkholderia silvatlantica]PVY30308.1 peptide/nickel transport system ATP-binding protein [Paraburkholderia silvatlantica]PXW36956.1 peptide/nickel transport system ATP-binding protein [Paraburkholderia silvatlantica]TDQ86564.1 peptide/nickel transport system ATP-binding protein [Paraburkholderia silvatlantica]
MSALLEVEHLQVELPTPNGPLRAVRGIDLEIARGEMLCLVGESGCGKSMTSLALMGLLPRRAKRTAQRLRLDGRDLSALNDRDMAKLRGNRIAMIFQEPMTSLNPSHTIGRQLVEALRQHRSVTRAQARDRAVYLLERTGMTNAAQRLGQYPHQLSGGLRQRVMIAMALMCEPDLIVADEPTTALDVTIQAQILRMLRELQQEFGTAVLFVTHDLGVVARIADRVAVMYAGQLVETAPVGTLFAQPAHPYTRGLLGCIPVRGRQRPGTHLTAIPGVVPSLLGELSGCAFANRCAHASDACARTPPYPELEAGHRVRCVLAAGQPAATVEVP